MASLQFLLLGICAVFMATTEMAAACSDLISSCPTDPGNGLCLHPIYRHYVRVNCAKSCDLCNACFDVHDYGYCGVLKRSGYCTNDRHKDYMKTKCKETCGYCGGSGTTTQPPVYGGNCGKPEVAQGGVIAGVYAKKGAWPWQILMLFNGRKICGGSLVAPQWVVTAGHCVYGKESQASSFKVRVGEHITDRTSDGQHQDIGVEKIISHRPFTQYIFDNDIALMKLSYPVQYSKYVKSVCLPNQDQHVPVGTQCYITGWGGKMHHTLRQRKMPVVTNAACSNINTTNFGFNITDNMVCAGDGGATRVSSCRGDSGGPFVCQTGAGGRWVLHGALSWGSGNCDTRAGYTVFARISKFKSWIDRQMASN